MYYYTIILEVANANLGLRPDPDFVGPEAYKHGRPLKKLIKLEHKIV